MYRYLIKNKIKFTILCVLTILVASIEIVKAYLFQFLVDLAIISDNNSFLYGVIYSVIFLIICLILNILLNHSNANLVKESLINLKTDIFNGILKKDIPEFNKNNTSKYLSNLTNDVNILSNNFFNNMQELIYQIAVFTMSFVGILNINYLFIISIFILGYIPIFISKFFTKKIKLLKKDYSDKLYKFTNKVNDMVSGFEVIKSFNVEKHSMNKFSTINNEVEETSFKTNLTESLLETINSICGLTLFFFNMLLGVYLVINNKITVGEMIATIQLMNNIINPLNRVVNLRNSMKSVNLIYKDLSRIINYNTDKEHKSSVLNFEDSIKIENLSFSYNECEHIIKNFSHSFNKNKKYLIIGESGSGKSTLLKIIGNYYKNYEGNIFLDNINYKDIDEKYLYKILSLIHQNIFIFNDTIKNNICLYEEFDSIKLNAAIKKAGLNNVIDNLDLKEESFVEENGRNFSGGEKQRIAIARTLIKETPILLIDEATSALDNINSYNIEKTILNLENITVISISHKINKELIEMYDEIIVMSNGEIVEYGSYEDLIKINGYFCSLNLGEEITEYN